MTPSTDTGTRRRGPRPGTPRGPRMTRAAREQQLLDVAEQVFAESGYTDTTMEQIAARAGITKPVIYDHFGSKERLLSAVVERARDELFEALVTTFGEMPAEARTEDYLRAGTRSFMEFFERRQASFRSYVQESAVAAAAGGEIEELRQHHAQLVADQLGLIPALRDADPLVREGVAEIVIATNERVAGWRLRHPEITTDQAVDLVTSMLYGGLRALLKRDGGVARLG